MPQQGAGQFMAGGARGQAQVLHLPAAATAVEPAADDQPERLLAAESHQHLGCERGSSQKRLHKPLGQAQQHGPLQYRLQGQKGGIGE